MMFSNLLFPDLILYKPYYKKGPMNVQYEKNHQTIKQSEMTSFLFLCDFSQSQNSAQSVMTSQNQPLQSSEDLHCQPNHHPAPVTGSYVT